MKPRDLPQAGGDWGLRSNGIGTRSRKSRKSIMEPAKLDATPKNVSILINSVITESLLTEYLPLRSGEYTRYPNRARN